VRGGRQTATGRDRTTPAIDARANAAPVIRMGRLLDMGTCFLQPVFRR